MADLYVEERLTPLGTAAEASLMSATHAAQYKQEGNAHFRAGRWKDACEAYAKATVVADADEDAALLSRVLSNRALCHAKRARWDASLVDAERAAALDTTNAKAVHHAAVARAHGAVGVVAPRADTAEVPRADSVLGAGVAVEACKGFGVGVVATRDLAWGAAVVCGEWPLVWVTSAAMSRRVCAACLCELERSELVGCAHCGVAVYCSDACRRRDWAVGGHAWECGSATAARNDARAELVRMVVRLCFAAAHRADVWEAALALCGAVGDEAAAVVPIVGEVRAHLTTHVVAGVLRGRVDVLAALPAVVRVVVCNNWTVRGEVGDVGLALYAHTARMNHSCVPNVSVSFHGARITKRVQAAGGVHAGAQLFTCYGMQAGKHSLDERRRVLRRVYAFTCKCAACARGWDTCMAVQCARCGEATDSGASTCVACGASDGVDVAAASAHMRRVAEAAQGPAVRVDTLQALVTSGLTVLDARSVLYGAVHAAFVRAALADAQRRADPACVLRSACAAHAAAQHVHGARSVDALSVLPLVAEAHAYAGDAEAAARTREEHRRATATLTSERSKP